MNTTKDATFGQLCKKNSDLLLQQSSNTTRNSTSKSCVQNLTKSTIILIKKSTDYAEWPISA